MNYNDTNNAKKYSRRRAVIAVVSIVCALVTAFGAVSFALSTLFPSTAENSALFDGLYSDSAKAVDFENCVYRIDDNGNVWEESDETIRLVLKKEGALLLAVYDSVMYVLTENEKDGYILSKLDIINGLLSDSQKLGKSKVNCFSMTDEGVYYLSEGKVFFLSGGKISEMLDLSSLTYVCKEEDEHHSHENDVSLSDTESFTVNSENSIILYVPNPDYIDEEETPTNGEGENDKYITFMYDFSSESLSEYSDIDISAGASMMATSSKITLNGVTVPFSNYPPYSSYFTKNGKACTCHNRNQCLVNSSPCNCLRYIKHNGYTFDLAATQCFGFARYCQLKIFGHTDGSAPAKYTNALGGAWDTGKFTANDLMSVFLEYGAGGHIRTKAGHSLFVISVNATGFTTYECNTNAKDCLVYTRDWTWATFYNSVKSRGIYYYKIPTDFSGSAGTITDNYPTGDYLVDADGGLRLREKQTTSSAILATIPDGTIISITETIEIDGASTNRWWGKTTYDGKTGWVSLDYARLQSEISAIKITSLPERTVFYQDEQFSYDGLEVQLVYASGTYGTLPGGYKVTPPSMAHPGTYKVTVSYLSYSTTYEITIKSIAILPEKIVFERPTITVMTGGEFTPVYGVDYNVLPADTNDKTVEWSVVSGSHLVSVDKTSGVVTASKAGAGFVEGSARIRASALAKDSYGNRVKVDADYTIEVIKAPVDGEWSQPATNLPDGVTLSDYIIEYCASESDFNRGNWKKYDGSSSVKVYKYRFRDSYKLTWYYDLDSSDGNIELPSSFDYPKSANIGESVSISRLKAATQTNRLFAGWFTSAEGARNLDKKLAYNGSAITADTEFFAGWIDLSSEEFLVNAAENDPIHAVGKNLQAFGVFESDINISDDSGGLRFYGHISSALADKLATLNTTAISYGMVVQIASKTSGALTSATSEGYLQNGKSIVVTAKKNYGEFKFLGSGSYTVFTTLVANIPIEDAKTDIAARAFITYYDANGNRRTFYYTNTAENTPDMTLKASGITSNLYKCAEKIYASASDLEKNWLIENVLGHDYE